MCDSAVVNTFTDRMASEYSDPDTETIERLAPSEVTSTFMEIECTHQDSEGVEPSNNEDIETASTLIELMTTETENIEVPVTVSTPHSTVSKFKKINQIASDSSDEDEVVPNVSPILENDDDNLLSKSKISNRILDSDSDNEDLNPRSSIKVTKLNSILDSDSEDEPTFNTEKNDNSPEKNVEAEDRIDLNTEVYGTKEENQLIKENSVSNRLKALYDSESSEDETSRHTSNQEIPEVVKSKKKNTRKPQSKPEGSVTKPMTAKEAQLQRQEIYSESQRMLRESRVSLPYHVPKARSIREFLEKRPRFSLAVPNEIASTPPSIAIKACAQQLEVVNKRLKEREKEVKKFYKSESESDHEDPDEGVDKVTNLEDNKPKENGASSNESANVYSTENQEELMEVTEKIVMQEENGAILNQENINTECMDDTKTQDKMSLNASDTTKEIDKVSEIQVNNADSSPEVVENQVNTPTENVEDSEIDTLEPPQPTVEVNQAAETEIGSLPDQCDTDYAVLEDQNEQNDNNILNTDKESSKTPEKDTKNDSGTSATHLLDEEQANLLDYDFNLDGIEDVVSENTIPAEIPQEKSEDRTPPKKNSHILDLVKQQFSNIKPRLSGGPNLEIDLEEGVVRPSEINKFMERFMQHTGKKSVAKNKVELNVMNFTQGEIHEETLAIPIDTEEDTKEINEIPGVRLRKLRDDLQNQISQRRSELWQQKAQNLVNKTEDDNKDDAILDDDEEAELTDIEEEEEEDEEDYEEYLKRTEKPMVKSKFISEEAEESDIQDEDDAEHEGEEMDEVNDKPDENSDDEDETNQEEAEEETAIKKSRIIKRFTEDSDEEEAEVNENEKTPIEIKNLNNMSTDTCEEEEHLPPNQPMLETPCRITQNQSYLECLTPALPLTGLQNLNSGSKESPAFSPFVPPSDSPCLKKTTLQKKLFPNLGGSEENLDDIAAMCSGQFASSQGEDNMDPDNITTQDLLGLCSGKFDSNENLEAATRRDENEKSMINVGVSEEIKNLEDDGLISELLDEEEMEKFKKKFDSPVVLSEDKEIQGGGKILSDSEEENAHSEERIKRKKLQKRLDFSDDESSKDNESSDEDEGEEDQSEEVIDLHENLDDREVDYDSEENEVLVESDGLKASDFFEYEAELSESEWGSEDEDEKGLDKLETEQADAEVFDETKLRTDLEKIHMRRILDDDTKEVKILQELLLEDGELHGTGRQRQFRWRNIDATDDTENNDKDVVDTFLDEDDTEEQWRRMRHEREMYLKKCSQKIDNEDDVIPSNSNSQVMKLGQEAIRTNLSIHQSVEKTKSVKIVTSPDIKQPFMLLNKRGSFLTRSEQVLTKLAEITKVSDPAAGISAKKSKHFLFQAVSSVHIETKLTPLPEGKKRKASGSTPNILKKLRLSSNMTPVKSSDKKKKLF